MVKKSAIIRIRDVLDNLRKQAYAIDNTNSTSSAHKLLSDNDLFSITLFTTSSDQFSHYVNETNKKLNEFEKLLNENHNELASALLTQIEQQIAALSTALKANNALHQDSLYQLNKRKRKRKAQQPQYKKAAQAIMQSSQNLYQKLAEHHEYERRLATMIAEREYKRADCSIKASQQITQEILKLHQRLGRCRQAISQIEKDIERIEKDI